MAFPKPTCEESVGKKKCGKKATHIRMKNDGSLIYVCKPHVNICRSIDLKVIKIPKK